MATNHDRVARQIAKKEGVDYNPGKGADVIGDERVIEVETENTVGEGIRQLQGYRKPVYIAGPSQKAVEKAVEVTKGTTVGVVNRQGKVVKRSSRSRT